MKPARSLPCKVCGEIFDSVLDLSRHQNDEKVNHTYTLPRKHVNLGFPIQCEKCMICFSVEKNLREHKAKVCDVGATATSPAAKQSSTATAAPPASSKADIASSLRSTIASATASAIATTNAIVHAARNSNSAESKSSVSAANTAAASSSAAVSANNSPAPATTSTLSAVDAARVALHLQTYGPNSRFMYVCLVCGKPFDSEYGLDRHMKSTTLKHHFTTCCMEAVVAAGAGAGEGSSGNGPSTELGPNSLPLQYPFQCSQCKLCVQTEAHLNLHRDHSVCAVALAAAVCSPIPVPANASSTRKRSNSALSSIGGGSSGGDADAGDDCISSSRRSRGGSSLTDLDIFGFPESKSSGGARRSKRVRVLVPRERQLYYNIASLLIAKSKRENGAPVSASDTKAPQPFPTIDENNYLTFVKDESPSGSAAESTEGAAEDDDEEDTKVSRSQFLQHLKEILNCEV